jgi:hypothetical protein
MRPIGVRAPATITDTGRSELVMDVALSNVIGDVRTTLTVAAGKGLGA